MIAERHVLAVEGACLLRSCCTELAECSSSAAAPCAVPAAKMLDGLSQYRQGCSAAQALQRQDVAAAAEAETEAAATLTAAATQQRTLSSPSRAAAAPSPAAVVAACPQCARQKRSAAPCVRRPCREAQATCRKLVSRAAAIVFAALRSMQLMGHQIFDKSAAAGYSLKLGFLLCCINRSMGIKPRTTQHCTPGTANTKHAAAGRVAGQVLLRKKKRLYGHGCG